MELPKLTDVPMTCTHVCYLAYDLDKSSETLAALGAQEVVRTEFPGGVSIMSALAASAPRFTNPEAAGLVPEINGLMFELIVPTGEGTLYGDHLARNGPGLHHIGVKVPDFDQGFESFTSAGCTVLMKPQTRSVDVPDGTKRDLKMCFLDCAPIGFPTIELVSL